MYKIDSDKAPKIREWLTRGSRVAAWRNADLGSASVGAYAYTEVRPGSAPVSPHWRYTNKPVALILTGEAFTVQVWTEKARVKVRSGPPCFGSICRADRPKLDKALALAGEGASWSPDYDSCAYGSPWFIAVVEVPSYETF